ncbi:hypothetical protein JKP88DRAFT_353589 [Tribonema minus]|uniref:Ankyrin repeat domain-containing protein n=1 Tax=Tribonema minus TaxID=303371 RepID=A0A836CJH5_9STRA|nr:hypothetical protein JKP88DRAFT_353589 [Tribonema minus]
MSAVDFESAEWTGVPHGVVEMFRDPEWAEFLIPRVTGAISLLDAAAMGGHVEVLRWLHQEQATPFTHLTMAGAAFHKRLTALQWLYQAGCPYDIDRICSLSLQARISPAALTPQLMEWLRSIGALEQASSRERQQRAPPA